tara:strand:- start:7830 stop:8126 length:297 start_codon:yes stop_codon:yes gene_type:complete
VRIDSATTDVPTAGTQVQILNTKARVAWIKFTAPTANTGLTYVGASDVSSALGYPLGAAGGVDATVELDFRPGTISADALWVDAAVNGEDVAWIAILR